MKVWIPAGVYTREGGCRNDEKGGMDPRLRGDDRGECGDDKKGDPETSSG
jgi:hypothetical protein